MTSQRIFLMFVSLAAMLGGFIFGFDAAVISEIIPFVSFQFRMTPLQETLFVEAGLVGGLLSIVLGGIGSDRWGRKPAMLLGALLILTGISGCILAEDQFGLQCVGLYGFV